MRGIYTDTLAPSKTMSNTAVTYVSLVLSLCAITVLIITGITSHREFDKEEHTLSTAHVWHYNHSTGVAATHTDVGTVCVGYNDCPEAVEQRVLRVNGGIRLGQGPVFRTALEGRIMVVEDNSGRQIARADLSTGATIIGDGLDLPEKGVQVNGYTDSGAHTDMWLATRGFSLFGSDETPASSVHSVVHREDAAVRGIRIAPPGPVRADHAVHITAQGIIVGDAPATFVRENAGKADVLVYGQSITQPNLGSPTACSIPPVQVPELALNNESTPHVLKLTTEYCNPALLQSIEKLPLSSASCNYQYAFIGDKGAFPLGKCSNDVTYYCTI